MQRRLARKHAPHPFMARATCVFDRPTAFVKPTEHVRQPALRGIRWQLPRLSRKALYGAATRASRSPRNLVLIAACRAFRSLD